MIHETAQHLIAFTDNVQFERLVLEVLSYHEYPGIDPQSPGLADGGKDALFYYDDGTCAWFAFSLRKDWKVKFGEDWDLAQHSGKTIRKFIFCTNRNIPALERDKLKEGKPAELDFWDGERLRVALDTNCKDIRHQYFHIYDNTTIRRQLRYTILDSMNEFPVDDPTSLEQAVFDSRAHRGVFELLKTVDISTVAESGPELSRLTILVESFFQFRLVATQLKTYTMNLIEKELPGTVILATGQSSPGTVSALPLCFQKNRFFGGARSMSEVDLILRFAKEIPTWDYDRIQGALANVGYQISDTTVGNILKAHGIEPAPDRQRQTTWATFLKAHWSQKKGVFDAGVVKPVGASAVLFGAQLAQHEVQCQHNVRDKHQVIFA